MTKIHVSDHPDQFFYKLQWNDKLAIATFREMSHSRNQIGNVDSQKTICCFEYPQIIYEYPLKMLIRTDFPFQNELNKFIEKATEGGLIVKWLKNYRSFGKEKSQYQYTTFKIESFPIALGIYIFMITLALITVIMEKLVHGKVRTPNSKPIWRYIEMAIDPYRYFLLKDLDWGK